MEEIKRAGTTIVVVSHNLQAVRNLCPRTVLLHDAAMRHDGDTDTAIALYHQALGEAREGIGPLDVRAERLDEVAEFGPLELIGPAGRATTQVAAHDEVVFRAPVRFNRAVEGAVFGFALGTDTGTTVYTDNTPMAGVGALPAGDAVLEVRMRLALAGGAYNAWVILRSNDGTTHLARLPPPLVFHVARRRLVTGVADLCAEFSVRPAEAQPAARHGDRHASPSTTPPSPPG
jgi:lipopolysaccharide transport system ATP-binding protein